MKLSFYYLQILKQTFSLPQVPDLVSMYRRGLSSRGLQGDAGRSVAFDEIHWRSVARLSVCVVVENGEDDGEDPDQW